MIHEFDVRRRGDVILLGVAIEQAILDVETNEKLLRDALALIDAPHTGVNDVRIGRFGDFPVRLNIHADDSASLFVDGPEFEPLREQCAAIFVSKDELRRVIHSALNGT